MLFRQIFKNHLKMFFETTLKKYFRVIAWNIEENSIYLRLVLCTLFSRWSSHCSKKLKILFMPPVEMGIDAQFV